MSKTHHSYLNGQWHAGGGEFAVDDPGLGEPFATCSAVGYTEALQAIECAAAFPQWGRLPAIQRANYLLRIADNVTKRKEQIAHTLTRENGKPLPEAYAEVDGTIDHFRWFAEEARRAYGRIIPNQAVGKRHWVLKRPFGVVAAISPWNFPLVLSARKVAPALAAGCTVLLRPSRQTPLCCVLLAECIAEAGVPPEVFQLLLGEAAPISKALMEHPQCRKISFTGSTAVGRRLIADSAQSITKLSLELGGQAPVLVFDDCDMEVAINGALMSKTRNVGQSCIAANRFYVQRPIYDQFVERFARAMKALRVDYGLNDGCEVGALESTNGLNHALTHIADAVRCGGEVVTGGTACDVGERYRHGSYLTPTVIANVPQNALCMREETFAPVAPVQPFDDEDEAIQKANDTEYGLAAYAYTNNLNRTIRLSEQLESGTIGINDPVPSTSNCPFGGFKQSGSGRELGSEGMEEFLEPVHLSIGGQDY